MSWFEKLTSWLNSQSTSPQALPMQKLQGKLETARLLRRRGDYDNALHELNNALTLADTLHHQTVLFSIRLHQIDILIRLHRLDEARTIITSLLEQADDSNKLYHAYIQIALGMLEQADQQIEQARHHYERGLRLAQEIHAVGAHGRAQGHLADTYLMEENASYAVYLFEEALPRLNASGEIEIACYFVGRFGQAMIQTGKMLEGVQIIGRALRMSEQLSYRQYEVMWRQELAFYALQQGIYDEARRHLMVLLTQIDPQQTPKDYTLTLCRLAKACLRLGEYTAALDYAQQAVDFAAQQDAKPLTALTMATHGIVLRTMGQPNQALSSLQIAAQSCDMLPTNQTDFSALDVLRNLGAAQTEIGNFEVAYQTYQLAMTQAEQAGLKHDLAGIYRDVGIYHMRQNNLNDALQSWTTALKIYEAEGDHARVARLYCDIANVRRGFGQAKRALRDYEQALMLLNAFQDDETRGVVLSNAATAYVDYGDVETAESFFIESIQIAQRLQDRQSEATRRGNYGWFLLNTGRAKLAIQTLEYALRQSENLGLKLQVAVQTDNIGSAYDEMKEYDHALAFHAKAWERIKQLDEPHWKAFIGANLAHTLLALDYLDDADTTLKAAYEVAQQSKHPDLLMRCLNGMAKLALKRGELNDVQLFLNQVFELAEQSGIRRLLADAWLIHSEWAARQGDYQQAQSDWQKAADLLKLLMIQLERPDWLVI
ncbi:MAG: hypothetical protein D6711_14830 [Chloroflexi bacterium]|nr:MAG: hypothetical protein D6711_14830 [Chloroflexota bacterium]